MVIGVADFEVESFENKNKVEVSNWVFPENKEQGFYNYRFHSKALDYFTELLGPYSYEKLAHVQSKTRYGGMENAGCIFYHERTGTSDQSQERLFAHEVAHQWFGNSVSEENWHHVWLSEGFATYLTHVYNRHFYGDDKFREGLKNDREWIIRYAKQNFAPIIDTTITEYTKLLNTNSYQKASWVLHMLQTELGDKIFFKGLRKYYADFQNSTALTEDFQHVMEEVSGKDLDVFFRQWLWQAGHPVLDWSWKQMSGNLYISIKQVQKESSFNFPLKIQIIYENGTSEFMDYNSIGTTMNINAEINGKVKNVILDPEVGLLFEVN
jgi:aminopeptidase N